ncbi:MAG: trigger factor, partial [Bacteroidota bacterium]|nr:trigger factor [Bacteroidota bacterium]
MDIKKENIDDLNALVRIQITEDDYKENVDKVLQDYRKKAKVDGFRPGKTPLGLVKKMYGMAILADEVNKLLSESLTKFLYSDDFRVLGEPLPSENSPTIEWETQKDFEFAFDIGIAPEVEVNLSKRDKIKWYKIDVDETLINDQVENYAKKFGNFEIAEISEVDDMVKGDLTEQDENGIQKDGGIVALDALVSLNTISDKEAKDQFIGLKAGDEIQLDMLKSFPNETDRAALLKIEKDQLENISNTFSYTIGEVSRFAPAPVNQELFDQAYGPDQVKSEEEFRQKIKEDLQAQFDRESLYKFHIDTKEKLVNKTNIELPDEFLKRWMLATSKDEKMTKESLEEEYPRFGEDLKWQLIKDL